MRTIITFCLLALVAIPAQAEHNDVYQFQAVSKKISKADTFWKNFWNILSGASTPMASDLSVKVVSAKNGAPISGATVMVGQKKGDPFASNIATTDSNGMAFFSDSSLQTGKAFTVTASMNGFGNFSLIENSQNSVELTLQPATRSRDNSFLQGKLTGFPPGYPSSQAEIGMFIPGFRPESLMNFDPQQIVSSYKVEIDVFGKREVPGNVVLPKQSKRYGIIPISLEKPEFIMPLPNGLRTHMSGIVGAVPIGDAYNAVKNKDFLAVLNMTTLTHVGFTNRMTVRGNDRFDFNAGMELEQKVVRAKLSGVAAKLDAVAVSLFDPESDREDYIPMDVKALKSEEMKNGEGQIKLSTLKQRKNQDKFYVFTGLINRDELQNNQNGRSMVGSLMPVNNSDLKARFDSFLKPIVAQGVASGNREYKFTSAANTREKLSPEMVIVNIISQKKNAQTQGVTRSVIWSAVVNGSADHVSLPDLGRPVLPNPDSANGEEFSWEVLAISTGNKFSANNGEVDVQSNLRNLKHVSSLAKKF